MILTEPETTHSSLEMLLDYHRLLRIVEKECGSVLDEDSTTRLMRLIVDRIQLLELPAALELEKARDQRGCLS